ncbi:uncharacterized protein LOC119934453 [Tachyglossus aculeatus]|uniref:uncharacterized protein LOC119934453 n=1 Tax=Tachyglossus aculeatus TaxID=9261 RepID=UPI0018F32FE0|nr:uncharacterized protein LOC119934453 [Tachyglossus aculeatus]
MDRTRHPTCPAPPQASVFLPFIHTTSVLANLGCSCRARARSPFAERSGRRAMLLSSPELLLLLLSVHETWATGRWAFGPGPRAEWAAGEAERGGERPACTSRAVRARRERPRGGGRLPTGSCGEVSPPHISMWDSGKMWPPLPAFVQGEGRRPVLGLLLIWQLRRAALHQPTGRKSERERPPGPGESRAPTSRISLPAQAVPPAPSSNRPAPYGPR